VLDFKPEGLTIIQPRVQLLKLRILAFCRLKRRQTSPNGAILDEPRVERREGTNVAEPWVLYPFDAKTPKGWR
jgi:hypothetical protein